MKLKKKEDFDYQRFEQAALNATWALNAALNLIFMLLLLLCGERMPFFNFAGGSILGE